MAAIAKFEIIKDASKLEAESKALAQQLIDNDTRIQSYLLSEVAHIEEHRNPTRLNKFITTLLVHEDGKTKRNIGVRVNAMVAFIITFANVSMPKGKDGKAASLTSIMNEATPDGKGKQYWNAKENYFSFFTMKKERKDALTKPVLRTLPDGEKRKVSLWDMAQSQPWFSFKPEDHSKPIFDFNAVLKQAVKKAVNASIEAKKGKESAYSEVKNLDESFLADLVKLCMEHGMKAEDIAPSDHSLLDDNLKAQLEVANENEETVTEETVTEEVEAKVAAAKRRNKAA